MESVEPVLTVKSVYRSVDWYCNFLGFTADFLNEELGEENSLNYAVLRNGNAGIHLGLESDTGFWPETEDVISSLGSLTSCITGL